MNQYQPADRVEQTEIAQHDHPGHQPHLFRQENAQRHDAEHQMIAAKPP